MLKPRSLPTLLLAAALLAGQWLAAAHEPEHALQPGVAHGCAACIHAHGAGAGALAALPQLVLDNSAEAPARPPVEDPVAVAARHHPIRAPPQLL